MSESPIRRTAALLGNHRVTILEETVPELKPGHVLIEVHRSLISPGSELGGWSAYAEKRRTGNGATAPPKPFGYSNSGIVVSSASDEFKPGDRVAALGAGKALHSTHALMPHHLCTKLPDAVSFEEGAYAMLLATALQGIRRAKPEFGEIYAVVGLGILGQLGARLLQLSGCFCIGSDRVRMRCDLALGHNIDSIAAQGTEEEAIRRFSNARGLDGALLCFNGEGESTYDILFRSMKKTPDGHAMGKLVILGHVLFPIKTRPMSNIDILMASRTGPGYHDATWETGSDYPGVHVRWTTRSNVELCLRLVAERKIDVARLTTHRFPMENLESGLDSILERPDEILGVILEMKS